MNVNIEGRLSPCTRTSSFWGLELTPYIRVFPSVVCPHSPFLHPPPSSLCSLLSTLSSTPGLSPLPLLPCSTNNKQHRNRQVRCVGLSAARSPAPLPPPPPPSPAPPPPPPPSSPSLPGHPRRAPTYEAAAEHVSSPLLHVVPLTICSTYCPQLHSAH